MKFAVGQEVRVVGNAWGGRPSIGRSATVTKIGRSLVHVSGGWADKGQKFNMETGYESRPTTAIGMGDHVFTLAEVADQCHRARVVAELYAKGLDLARRHDGVRVSTMKLAEVLEVLDR